MRISKTTAESIAKSLLEHKQKDINSLNQEIKDCVTEYYESLIPKNVLTFHKNYPGWIRETSCVSIKSGIFNFQMFDLSRKLPQIQMTSTITGVDSQFLKALEKLTMKRSKLTSGLRELRDDTISTLLSLGTTKRVSEVFPEAAKFLPAEGSTMTKALAVNIEALRKRIA